MPEQLNDSRETSRLRFLGNIAVAGATGVVTWESINLFAENTPLPIVFGTIAASSIYQLMKRLS